MKKKQDVYIVVKLKAPLKMDLPKDEKGNVTWSRESCIYDYIQHWLEEGYFVGDHIVELPQNIKYGGFELILDKDKIAGISKIIRKKHPVTKNSTTLGRAK